MRRMIQIGLALLMVSHVLSAQQTNISSGNREPQKQRDSFSMFLGRVGYFLASDSAFKDIYGTFGFKLFSYGIRTDRISIGWQSELVADESPWPMFGHDAQHTNLSTLLGPRDSEVEWSYQLGLSGVPPASPVVDHEGTIYIKNLAVKKNGTLKWEATDPRVSMDGAAILSNGLIIFISRYDENLYAVNQDSGNIIWQFSKGSTWGGRIRLSLLVRTG